MSDKKFDVILFDLDGTLCDSERGIAQCISAALDYYKIPYDDAILHKMVGPPFRVSMREFFGVDDERVEGMISIYRGLYDVDGWRNCNVYDGIESLLSRLKEDGFRLAVATSKPLRFTEKMIKELDLAKYFEFVGGAESDSSRDSKTAVIEYVFENMNITDKSKVVIVGDRLYDIVGAKNTGISSIGALWGYGTQEELESYGADYVFATPDEVYEFLSR